MPLGKPGPVTPLFVVPVFFFKHLWSGLGGHYSQGCHEYIPSRLTYGSLPFHHTHTHLLSMGLNVAKCNLGEAKHETMLASSLHY